MEVLIAQLRTGRLDMVLGGASERDNSPKDLVQHHLMNEVLRLVVSPTHPQALQQPLAWADLMAYPWVLPPRTERVRQSLDLALQRMGVKAPSNQIETVATGLVPGLLSEIQAVACVTGQLARTFESSGLASTLELEINDVLLKLSTFTVAGRVPTPAMDLLKKCVSLAVAD